MPPKKGTRKYKEAERERKRKEWEQQSAEYRDKRLQQMKEYSANKKLEMSTQEYEEWSDQRKRNEAHRRDQMSPEDKTEWTDQKKAHEKARRDQMTPEHKTEWKDQKKAHEKARRDQMTPEHKTGWKDQKKAHEKSRRDQMTPEYKKEWKDQKKSHERSRKEVMNPDEKDLHQQKNRETQSRKRKYDKGKVVTIQEAAENFRRKCYELPEYICTCCHRLLWRQSVLPYKMDKYDSTNDIIKKCLAPDILRETKPGEMYICTTCNGDLKKKKPIMPAQAVANGLRLDPTPPGNLQKPNQMEIMMFRREIPFMKLGALPRGRQYRMQGPVVNVPSKIESICQLLPRLPNDAMLVPIKLKRRLCYKGHYLYDSIRPHVVLEWLKWLKENNPHYTDVNINIDWCNLMAQFGDDGNY